MTDIGMKFAKDGKNVLGPLGPSDLLMSTRFKMLQIKMEGKQTIPASSQVALTHNLGYAPIFLIYAASNMLVNYKILATGAQVLTFLRTNTTTSETTILDTKGTTREVYYNILEDPISLQ